MDTLIVEEKSMLTMEDVEATLAQFRIQIDTFNGQLSQAKFGSKIYQTKETIASKGRFIAGAKEDVVIMDGQNPTWRLWAGASNPASAPFRVDKDGNMVATSITLTGYVQTGGAAADINANATTISGGKITTNTITANKISVSNLSSISADIGTITAGAINGITITGSVIQTSSTGLRTVLNGSNDSIRFMNGSTIYSQIYPYAFPQGNGIYVETGSVKGSGDAYMYISEGTHNSAGIGTISADIDFYDSDCTITASTTTLSGKLILNSITQPYIYFGYCSGTSVSTTNTSFSLSNPSTGKYTLTHNFSTTSYTVTATALRGSGAGAYQVKVEARNSNSVQFTVFDDTGTVQNGDFMFTICKVA